ncbi:hypothetical protein TNCV_4272421 [Trichonephila clavipes]|nr:hypothetical protein TNCV_4272421 [Trichonephila clavipes]
MEVFVAIQRDACKDIQASAAVMVNFSNIRGQVPGSFHMKVGCESLVSLASRFIVVLSIGENIKGLGGGPDPRTPQIGVLWYSGERGASSGVVHVA